MTALGPRPPDTPVASRLDQKADLARAAASHDASDVRVLGSVARGWLGPTSDCDLLVDLEAGRTLHDHVGLRQVGRVHPLNGITYQHSDRSWNTKQP